MKVSGSQKAGLGIPRQAESPDTVKFDGKGAGGGAFSGGSAAQALAKKADGPRPGSAGPVPSLKTAFADRAGVPAAPGGPSAADISFQDPVSRKPAGGGAQLVPAREIYMRTAASLGLPRDFLSAALIAFSRFFSVPADPELLGGLRRGILSRLKQSSPKSPEGRAALEAQVLGAISALDKGAVLSADALDHYARFSGCPAFTGGAGGQDGGEYAGTGAGGDGKAAAGADGRESPPGGEEAPSADRVRVAAVDASARDGLLSFLNSLPGGNGQRWLVFPFEITVNGIELRVFLRILKKDGGGVRLIADIAGPRKQWRWFLEESGGGVSADMQVYPGLSPRALDTLRKEAERFFGAAGGPARNFRGFEKISAGNRGELPSWTGGLCAQPLPSVDKEV